MKKKLRIPKNIHKRILRSKTCLFIFVFCAFALWSTALQAQIRVVSTSMDLASIAKEVGGRRIQVQSLAKGSDDVHYLAARPDYALKLNRAELLLFVGAGLEIGWLPLVLGNSRNVDIQAGGRGHCDISKGIVLLGKKKGEINRQMGDLHPQGNPHYWPDPLNGIRIAKRIADCLSRIDYQRQSLYQKNYQAFKAKAITLTKRLLKKMKPHFGKSLLVYHNEFLYLTKRFRLKTAAYIEKKPGVPPGRAHINSMLDLVRQKRIKVILISPWSDAGAARDIAKRSQAKLLILPIQSQSAKGTESYLKMIEKCVYLLTEALSKK